MLRRGLTIEAMRQFIFEQGASKAVNLQTWDKLWSLNKKVLVACNECCRNGVHGDGFFI